MTAALHRVLLAILYRSLTPKADSDELADWFADVWPVKQVTGYLEKWRERKRFWLFHETHPFWQVAKFESKEKKSWSVLAVEHNAYNAKVLFDHFDVFSGEKAHPSEVACWLAAAQTFAVSSGKSEIAHTSTAPSATSLLVFSMGANLRETLLLNFSYQGKDVTANDLPVWEREPETIDLLKTKPTREARGRADLYTWNSRTIRLYCDDDGMVSRIGFASGMGYESTDVLRDPNAAYAQYEDKGGTRLLPVKLKDRGLWRDFDAFLPNRPKTGKKDISCAPAVIDHTAALCEELEERERCRAGISVMVCGQVNDNAKIEFWRMERFVLPTAILDTSNDVRGTIRALLGMAEKWQGQLYKACTTFATECIRRDSDRKPAASDVNRVVSQMPCTPLYWNHLELAFKRNLEHGFAVWKNAETLWRNEIRTALSLAWQAQEDAVGDGDAWTIRAMTKAGGVIGKALKELAESAQDTPGKDGK